MFVIVQGTKTTWGINGNNVCRVKHDSELNRMDILYIDGHNDTIDNVDADGLRKIIEIFNGRGDPHPKPEPEPGPEPVPVERVSKSKSRSKKTNRVQRR